MSRDVARSELAVRLELARRILVARVERVRVQLEVLGHGSGQLGELRRERRVLRQALTARASHFDMRPL